MRDDGRKRRGRVDVRDRVVVVVIVAAAAAADVLRGLGGSHPPGQPPVPDVEVQGDAAAAGSGREPRGEAGAVAVPGA